MAEHLDKMPPVAPAVEEDPLPSSKCRHVTILNDKHHYILSVSERSAAELNGGRWRRLLAPFIYPPPHSTPRATV